MCNGVSSPRSARSDKNPFVRIAPGAASTRWRLYFLRTTHPLPMPGTIARLKQRLKQRFWRLGRATGYVRMRRKRFTALFLFVTHILGALTSVQALMTARTSQGAIAWAVSLNTFPYLAVPAYWVFGRSKFEGYVKQRRGTDGKGAPVVGDFIRRADRSGLIAPDTGGDKQLLDRLARLPATTGNDVELLRGGDAIFPSILEGIDRARNYVLVQYYIVRDDDLGKRLKRHLIAAMARGVKVKFIYDEVGSAGLPGNYLAELRGAGAEMLAFNSMKGITNRFQLNFRNHRKIVVTDGRMAWIGGANIGDEYTSGHQKMTALHDTAVKVTGPAVQTIQVSFEEDWLWASDRLLELEWTPEPAPAAANKTVRCIASGPADRLETCTLYFLHLINSATTRLWISSPYFVPDEQIVSALKLAALRGVDVRILVPDKGDSRLIDLSGWAFVPQLGAVGVKIHRHTRGFLHQKVILVDSDLATVGTANFDNRSFRLNFEITLEVRDRAFAGQVVAMLEKDFADARRVAPGEPDDRGFLFRFGVRAASLLAPIQ